VARVAPQEATKKIISPSRAAQAKKGTAVLRTEELVKVYSGRRVVDDVSIEVEPGEIVGLWARTAPVKLRRFI